MPSDDSPSSIISKTTLCWTLMPLVANIMAQPCGRVLSWRGRLRIYIRSSPILCVLDGLAFLMRVFVTRHLLRVSFHQALNSTIREKYKDVKDASEGLPRLERQTWLRWIFFIGGTLVPSITLMAMQGVLWIKVFWCMFLFGFLVTEAAALFHRRSVAPPICSLLPGIHNSPAREAVEKQVSPIFGIIEVWMFFLGVFCHCALLIWAFFGLWALRIPVYDALEGNERVTPISLWDLVVLLAMYSVGDVFIFMSVFFLFGALVLLFPDSSAAKNDDPTRRSYNYVGSIFGSFVFFFVSALFIYTTYLLSMERIPVVRDSILFTASVFSVPFFRWAMKKVCSLNPRLGEVLLISSGEGSPTAVDINALDGLIFFIVNIVICVLWYWLK